MVNSLFTYVYVSVCVCVCVYARSIQVHTNMEYIVYNNITELYSGQIESVLSWPAGNIEIPVWISHYVLSPFFYFLFFLIGCSHTRIQLKDI